MNNKKIKKICKNCKYAIIRKKSNDNTSNVICMKRTNFEKGKVYLTSEDDNCKNYFILNTDKALFGR